LRGLGRRTSITSTPAGGSAVTTSYLWCGSRISQARNAAGAVTRSYYAEAEYLPGPAQPLYYAPDQLGTVRRGFAGPTNAPAYAYDPYGQKLQAGAPLTDFTYAGMFANADSGLYLTKYRAYDPAAGRWLSRDPMGEGSDPIGNLYRYVQGNPLSYVDPQGDQAWPAIMFLGVIAWGFSYQFWFDSSGFGYDPFLTPSPPEPEPPPPSPLEPLNPPPSGKVCTDENRRGQPEIPPGVPQVSSIPEVRNFTPVTPRPNPPAPIPLPRPVGNR
jgi:RHS repeat-associated protein